MKMVILSLLSSGKGSLCPTTALQEDGETEKVSIKSVTGTLAYNTIITV